MNIVVCDDDIQILSKIEVLINECYRGEENRYSCDVFLSGEELLKHLNTDFNRYQIYILDIEMNNVTGLQIAAAIREKNMSAIIIFVTSHKELMQEAFDVLAFHFLVKPLDEEKTKKVLLRAIEYLNLRKCIYQFKKGKKINSLFYEQIIYFESIKRQTCIHASNNLYYYYGTLKQIIDVIDLQLFVQVHNSFIVNMEYIETVDGECVTMRTGERITITKKFYKSFNAAYRNYILMRLK